MSGTAVNAGNPRHRLLRTLKEHFRDVKVRPYRSKSERRPCPPFSFNAFEAEAPSLQAAESSPLIKRALADNTHEAASTDAVGPQLHALLNGLKDGVVQVRQEPRFLSSCVW